MTAPPRQAGQSLGPAVQVLCPGGALPPAAQTLSTPGRWGRPGPCPASAQAAGTQGAPAPPPHPRPFTWLSSRPPRGQPGPRLPLLGRRPGARMGSLPRRLPTESESHLGPTASCSTAAAAQKLRPSPELGASGLEGEGGGALPAAAGPSTEVGRGIRPGSRLQ